jgi:acyl-ACP thioesterase
VNRSNVPRGEDSEGAPMSMAAESDRFEQRFRVSWGDLDSNAHMANTSFLDRAADTRMY